jgi:asparagine synthase (glutamine-hydrolysing)
MCGINGGWAPSGLAKKEIERSLDAMRHRGPDDHGVFLQGPVFLGNRRLSIIDLEKGRQPIGNEDGSVVVVLNGEIYNYRELMHVLKSNGHMFSTDSDTEVLVHLYEEHGKNMCEHLRGMFAFALWDARSRELFVARDRFGKKPLYYVADSEGLIFASELKGLYPLIEITGRPWALNDQGIYDYLSLGVVPQPETIRQGVHSLPPASWMRYDGHHLQISEYWSLDYGPKIEKPYAEVLYEARDRIGEAVRLRLRSDVPLGVFLSAGIDSSVVAYEASREVGEALQTFTVQMTDRSLDESPVARRTSQALGISNTTLRLEINPVDDLQSVIRSYDQPFGDPSAIPSLRVANLAAGHVKVVLNGDGGDEIFSGYRRYLASRYGSVISWLPQSMLESLGGLLQRWTGTERRRSFIAFGARVMRGLAQEPGARYLAWTTDNMRETDKRQFWTGQTARATEDWIDSLAFDGYLSNLDMAMRTDLHVNFLSGLLVKMDIATMAASVEGRSPLMDHVVAEFAARLPDAHKMRYGRTKAILRDAYAGILPEEVVCGPKLGFEPPVLNWLHGELKPLLMDTLGTHTAKVRSYVQGRFIDDLLQKKVMTDRNWAMLVYTLLVLELWLRESA